MNALFAVLAVAGFATFSLLARGSTSVVVAVAARFAVLPHDDGCRWWLSAVDATRFEVVLELRVLEPFTSLEDVSAMAAEATRLGAATAAVLVVVVVAGRFLGTSKSRRDVCLLLLRVRLHTDWIGFMMMVL